MSNFEKSTPPIDPFEAIENLSSYATRQSDGVAPSFRIEFGPDNTIVKVDARIHPETPPVLVDGLTILSGIEKVSVQHASGAKKLSLTERAIRSRSRHD